jgi:lipopolysaccharide transport system ATP-binding protein
MAAIISIQNLSKRYYVEKLKHTSKVMSFTELFKLPYQILFGDIFQIRNQKYKTLWALKDISLDIQQGERLGIIGKNGAGKTTLLKILARLIFPTKGEVVLYGRSTALFGVGVGFKPKLTGRENVYYSASLHGLKRKEIDSKFDEILKFSGIERYIDNPLQTYSKGMRTRLAFSVAAHLDPDILLLDEVLAGGDMAFQKKCLEKMEGHARSGRTIVFVSHNMNAVVKLCNRCIWIEDGQIIEKGEPSQVVKAYSKRMLKLQSSYKADAPDRPPRHQCIEESQDGGGVGAKLLSMRLTNKDRVEKEIYFRDESIHVEIIYQVIRDDIDIIPVLHLHRDGTHVWTTHPTEIFGAPKGTACKAQTIIPGNLLNNGDYDFSLALVTPARPKWRHVYIENILSVKIVPEANPNPIFSGDYRGCIRLDLAWESTAVKTTPSETLN